MHKTKRVEKLAFFYAKEFIKPMVCLLNLSGCSTFTTWPQLSITKSEAVRCFETMFFMEGKNK